MTIVKVILRNCVQRKLLHLICAPRFALPATDFDNGVMHIGEAIRSIRCSQGLTQEVVALEVGFATSNLSRLEKGEQAVSLNRLLAVAAALKVKASDIVKMIEAPAAGNERQLKEIEIVYDNEMQALHRAYRVLDDHHRMIGLLMLQDLARAQRAAK